MVLTIACALFPIIPQKMQDMDGVQRNLMITEGRGPCKHMRAGLFSGLHSMHTCSHLFALRNLSKFRKEAGGDVIYIDLQHLGRRVI